MAPTFGHDDLSSVITLAVVSIIIGAALWRRFSKPY